MRKILKIIKNADITEFSADVIVNSANHRLMMGRGVCGAIYRKAGRFKLWWACRKFKRPIDFGSAVITPAFRLKAKFIIHTASKKYIDGKHNEEKILRNCYLNSLKLAEKNNCKSIVFPLIASGIYGFPKEKSLETAISAIKDFLLSSENMEVFLIVN